MAIFLVQIFMSRLTEFGCKTSLNNKLTFVGVEVSFCVIFWRGIFLRSSFPEIPERGDDDVFLSVSRMLTFQIGMSL